MLLRRKNANSDIKKVSAILDGYDLPSFPAAASAALDELGDPEVSLQSVSMILERDPGLSVHFLRLANSASMGLRSGVDSLDRAIAILGRNQVESILIGKVVSASLKPKSAVIDQTRFWSTAAVRAVVSAQMASVIDPRHRSENFTAALLQDMALPVLADHVDGYEMTLRHWLDGEIDDLATAEMDLYGWHHGEVGAQMCVRWGFPDTLTSSIRTHHDEPTGPSTPTQLVEGWHEIDADQGPRILLERAATVPELADRAEDLLAEALESSADAISLFT